MSRTCVSLAVGFQRYRQVRLYVSCVLLVCRHMTRLSKCDLLFDATDVKPLILRLSVCLSVSLPVCVSEKRSLFVSCLKAIDMNPSKRPLSLLGSGVGKHSGL